MEINCTSCGARIPADDVNIDRLVAKCRTCNCVFDFSGQLAAASSESKQRRRAFVGLPAGMKVVVDEREVGGADDYRLAAGEHRGDFIVRRRWFDPATHIFMIVFCVFWDGFLAFWYSAALGNGVSKLGGGFGLFFLAFPLIHVTVGIGLTYSLIAGLFNATVVGVRGDNFIVHHGPIPWRGNRTVPARSITQLFCEEKVSKTKRGESRAYQLSAIVDGSERVRLVSGLPAIEQALFLEHALEERLGIVDEAVAGEVAA